MACKRAYNRATVLYSGDLNNIKIDDIRDSSWCFKESIQLEDGVRITFKAGNSVS
jgi:hypothetical protein